MIVDTLATSNYYPMPVYIRSDDRSDAEKCLDRADFTDIMNKQLKNEQLTDEDVDRINTCIAERRESNQKLVAVVIGVIVAIILLGVFVGMLS